MSDFMNLLAQNGGDSSKMESLLTCPICLDLFTKPVVILPCQHCLCRTCAEECFDKRGTRFGLHGGRFKCPTCRYEVVLDRHGVFGLNRNLLVESIIDMMEDEKKNEDKSVENKIKAAEDAEKKMQLDEIKKDLENAAAKEGKECKEHGDMLNVYCLTCQKLICATCKVFGDCQTCSVVKIETAFEQQQQEMREAIRLTTSATDGVQSAVTHCEDLVNRTRQIGGDSLHQINAQFDKIIKAMEDKKAQLMRKVQVETDTVEQQINNHAGKYSAALYGAQTDVSEAWTLADQEDQIKFLAKSRPCIDRMMQHQSDMQVRPPPFQPPNPAKWRLELSPMVEVIRKIDFGDMSRQQLKSQSSAINIKRNQSSDSLDEAPLMSKSMISPTTQRKIIHAPVQVPGFHRGGGFTIPANSMSSSGTGLRNDSTSLVRNESRGLLHIESESEQVGSSGTPNTAPRNSVNMPELKSTTKTKPIKLSEQEKKAAKSARAKFERTMSSSLMEESLTRRSLTENEKSVENLINSSLTNSTKLVRPGLEKVIPEIEKCEIEPVLFLKGKYPVSLPELKAHTTQITTTQNNSITNLKLPNIRESVTPSPRILPGFDTPTAGTPIVNSKNAAKFGQPLFACNDSDDNDAFEPEHDFSRLPLGVEPLDENTTRRLSMQSINSLPVSSGIFDQQSVKSVKSEQIPTPTSQNQTTSPRKSRSKQKKSNKKEKGSANIKQRMQRSMSVLSKNKSSASLESETGKAENQNRKNEQKKRTQSNSRKDSSTSWFGSIFK